MRYFLRTLKRKKIFNYRNIRTLILGCSAENLLLILGLLIFIIVIGSQLYFFGYNKTTLEGLLIEAHGLVIELFLFGFLLLKLEKSPNKDKYLELIDSYRNDKTEKASKVISDCIKRLNEMGIFEFDLSECYLKNAILNKSYIKNSKLENSNFMNTSLQYSDLSGSNVDSANFRDAVLDNSNLEGIDFSKAFIEKTSFRKARMKGVNLNDKDLTLNDLYDANLEKALLKNTKINSDLRLGSLEQADLRGADLKDAILDDSDESFFKVLLFGGISGTLETCSIKNAILDGDTKFPKSMKDKII